MVPAGQYAESLQRDRRVAGVEQTGAPSGKGVGAPAADDADRVIVDRVFARLAGGLDAVPQPAAAMGNQDQLAEVGRVAERGGDFGGQVGDVEDVLPVEPSRIERR